MSIGWALLINGIIGGLLYIPYVMVLQAICYRKFGQKNADQGLDNAVQLSETVEEQRGVSHSTSLMLNWILLIFLWEIMWPATAYMIWQAAKEEHRINGGGT